MGKARIIKLEEGASRTIRFYSDRISLDQGRSQSVVNITRTGRFHDDRYGDFDITPTMLQEMVRNFDERTYGQDIFLDVAHKPSDGGAAKVNRLFVQGDRLRAEVSFTPFGADAVKKRGFRYLSAEYSENYVSNEHPRKEHGALLMGAALTVRPVIKNLDPINPDTIELSEDDRPDLPHLIDPGFKRLLSEEMSSMKKYLELLRKALLDKKLSEANIKILCDLFEKAAVRVLEDEPALKALQEGFAEQGAALQKQLDATGGEKKLDLTGIEALIKTLPAAKPGEVKSLTEEDLTRFLDERDQKRAQKLLDDQAALDKNLALFDQTVAKADGLDKDDVKDLSDGVRPSISASMKPDHVIKLAETVTKGAEKIGAAKKLAARGYDPVGKVHTSPREQMAPAIKLQGEVNSKIQLAPAFQNRKLLEVGKEKPAVQRILALFDQVTGAERMENEVKFLSGGLTGIADVNLPSAFVRTVIRQALSDLNLLNLVNVLVDATTSMTLTIPYENRDTSQVVNQGIVYQAAGIPGMSMNQELDIAYLAAIKIAIKVSNEVMFFTRANKLIDWDAFARNVDMAARVVRELICVRIANEIQRVSDAYGAVTTSNEDYHTQLDGSTVNTIKTTNFPIVRQQQIYDMTGATVGNPSNPLTVKLNGATVLPYDGTGTQSNGTYYQVTSYNLGYIQFVNQAGVPQTPAYSSGATTVTYDSATNVTKFNTDLASGEELDLHWNGALQAVGSAKATLDQSRFVLADFIMMSAVLNDQMTNARDFSAAWARKASDLTDDGDLAMIKALPAFKTNAPGVDMGEERALLGVRGSTWYGVAKPFVMGIPFEAVNSTGQPTGQKVSYGEEYSTVHTPEPLQKFYTSVICYSATARTAES